MFLPPPRVVCFGEVLWDILPHGRYPGGAPFNVGYHLHRQGAEVCVASAVGTDPLGDELLARLTAWGIPTAGISRLEAFPTGTVTAELSPSGDARYTLHENVAWDRIHLTEATLRAAGGADAVIFGSLAQRSTFNRNSLDELLALLPAQAWRIFDVNLRAPFDDLALVGALAGKATVLKLNAAEAARLAAGAEEEPGQEEAHARRLQQETRCRIVCITAGARGAGLLADGEWLWEPGQPVAVADTVGAGDAFLATLTMRLLREPSHLRTALNAASRRGEWVASQQGATPAYP